MIRTRSLACLAAAAAGLALIGTAPGAASAANPNTMNWTVSTVPSGGALTLNLTKVSLRGPDFKVQLQQADGTFQDVTSQLPVEQDYLGTVKGRPDAAVAATVLNDGTVEGEIVFDRGITWWFTGAAVTGTRGSTTVTYKWPLRRSMDTDLIGSGSYRDEIGYDIDSSLYTALGNDPVKAMDMAEYSLNMMRLPYLQDLGLAPQLGTVILRGSATSDPYASLAASGGAYLGAVRNDWLTDRPSDPDAQVQVVSNRFGGGVAYLTSPYGSSSFGAVGGGTGGWVVVARHEATHNWGANDEHGGDPEGATIQSGNGYARYDSTEVYAIGQTRASLIAKGKLASLGTYTATQLPPYAGTDYLQVEAPSEGAKFNPLVNDHSANGSALHLVRVQAISNLGSPVSIIGNQIYYAGLSAPTTTIDWFTYVVADANGHTASGLVMVKNLAPFAQLESETGTTVTGGKVVTDGSDHSGTGYVQLNSGAGNSLTWTVNQPVERDVSLTFATKNGSAGNANVSVDGGTPTAVAVPKATAGPEGEGSIWTPVTLTVHLTKGSHTITYSTVDVAQNVDYLLAQWPDQAPVFTKTAAFTVPGGKAFSLTLSGYVTDPDLPNDQIVAFYLQAKYPWWTDRNNGAVLSGTAPPHGTYTASVDVFDASALIGRTTVTLTVS